LRDYLDNFKFNYNLNTTFGHVFHHLQNYPITIDYVVDPKNVLALAPLDPRHVFILVLANVVEKSN
jgi:hypothetical protein